ncbi:MAG: hypothetical protein ABSH24_03125 [Bryobacteraceae bacterium]|jgi:hypothetical protein
MACAICRIRKPRRFCPGVHGDICTLCCGKEREVTVDCPLDCPFLQEARKHERAQPLNPDEVPNRDVRITEEFLGEHDDLLLNAAKSLMLAAFDTPGAVDGDVRDALDALIRTQRTLQSGVYYETRPDNALANLIYSATQAGLEEFRKKEREDLGMSHTRDGDVLGILVFLQRLELDRENGRPRGRAFLDSLRGFLNEAQTNVRETARASSLIVP